MIVVFLQIMLNQKNLLKLNSFISLVKINMAILKYKKVYQINFKEKNDLQPIVEKKYPIIKKIMQFLKNQKNCVFSRMTGSGSACFGVF